MNEMKWFNFESNGGLFNIEGLAIHYRNAIGKNLSPEVKEFQLREID